MEGEGPWMEKDLVEMEGIRKIKIYIVLRGRERREWGEMEVEGREFIRWREGDGFDGEGERREGARLEEMDLKGNRKGGGGVTDEIKGKKREGWIESIEEEQ